MPGWVTRRSLHAFIRDATGIEASFGSISRLCRVWGLEHGRLQRPRAATTDKRMLQRDVAVCQVRRAIVAGDVLLGAARVLRQCCAGV